jgi:prepilin-type N-terminal cleavage/methylation domain-containing protein
MYGIVKKERAFTPLENYSVADKKPFSETGDEILCKSNGDLKGIEKQNSLTGFTLIEVLVAVTLFAIISFAISAVFTQGIRVWKVSQSKFELIMTAAFSLDSVDECINTFLSSGSCVIAGRADNLYIIDTKKEFDSPKVVYRLFLENEKDKRILKAGKVGEDGGLSPMQISPIDEFRISYFSELNGELTESGKIEDNAKVRAVELKIGLLNEKYGLKNSLSVCKLIKIKHYEER